MPVFCSFRSSSRAAPVPAGRRIGSSPCCSSVPLSSLLQVAMGTSDVSSYSPRSLGRLGALFDLSLLSFAHHLSFAVLALVIGDLHIPYRCHGASQRLHQLGQLTSGPDLPAKFKKLLVPGKIQQILRAPPSTYSSKPSLTH